MGRRHSVASHAQSVLTPSLIILPPKGVLELEPEESVTINLPAPGKVIIKSILRGGVSADAEREAAGPQAPARPRTRWVRLSRHCLVCGTGMPTAPALRAGGKRNVSPSLKLNSSGALRYSGVFRAPPASVLCLLGSPFSFTYTLCPCCH